MVKKHEKVIQINEFASTLPRQREKMNDEQKLLQLSNINMITDTNHKDLSNGNSTLLSLYYVILTIVRHLIVFYLKNL